MKLAFPARIFLIALIVRLLPVLLTRSLGIGLDDMIQYDMLARSLASGNGFRWYAQADLKLLQDYIDFDLEHVKDYDPQLGLFTSFRAPLYPAFLAVVYKIAGTDFSRFFAARVAQVFLLGAPLAPLTYFTARRLLAGQTLQPVQMQSAAKIAAWIVALYPMLIVYPLGLGTENPFFLLLFLSFYFLLRCLDQNRAWTPVIAGALLGLTSLTRSVILLFIILALLYLFLNHRKAAILAGAAFLIVIFPWVIRNSLLHGKLTGIETSMGYNLYLGYHPQGNGSFVFGPSLDLLKIVDDAERDTVGTRQALEFVRLHPDRIVPLAAARLGYFFGLEKRVLMYFYSNNLLGYIAPQTLIPVGLILVLPFVVLASLSAFSLPLLARDPKMVLLFMLFAAYLAPHVLILSEDRFHLALIPFLAILSSFVTVQKSMAWHSLWRSSSVGRVKVVFSALLVLMLFFNWGLEVSRDADKIGRLIGPNGNTTYYPY